MDRILHNGRVIEDERSPLHWADQDSGVYELALRRGDRNGKFVDVCASDEIDPRLQIISQKATKGYNRYSDPGSYEFEISAEAHAPCSNGKLLLHVCFDGKRSDSLEVIFSKSSRKYFRIW